MAGKFYITTAIPYVNAPPHVGFALELAQADVIARWQRMNGKDVFFLTGADEHGATVLRAAKRARKEVAEFVEGNTTIFKKLIEELGISSDDFIRTSDEKRHFPGAQELWKKLESSGDIYKKKYRGLYCVGHEAFVTKKDLTDGKCPEHDSEPEIIEEENYFFRLSKYATAINKAIESDELKVFPVSRKNEILAFLKEGLEDVSFSRPSKDISWGVPVPGDATQTMYVWSDALSNYITALGFGSDNLNKMKKFWPADLQVVGKNILRFHALIWPGMLLSAGLSLPKALFVHGFINSGGRKMSKTLGNVIDPLDFISRHGRDPLRYYLLRGIQTFEDGDFTEEKFVELYNADLANGIGNYVSRIVKMIENYFEGNLNKPSDSDLNGVPIKKHVSLFAFSEKDANLEFLAPPYFVDRMVWPAYKKSMEDYELKTTLDLVWSFLGDMDNYVQAYEPFKLVKTDPERARAVLWNLSYGALSIARMIGPFLPDTSEKIFKAFGVDSNMKEEWREVKVKLDKPLFMRK